MSKLYPSRITGDLPRYWLREFRSQIVTLVQFHSCISCLAEVRAEGCTSLYISGSLCDSHVITHFRCECFVRHGSKVVVNFRTRRSFEMLLRSVGSSRDVFPAHGDRKISKPAVMAGGGAGLMFCRAASASLAPLGRRSARRSTTWRTQTLW